MESSKDLRLNKCLFLLKTCMTDELSFDMIANEKRIHGKSIFLAGSSLNVLMESNSKQKYVTMELKIMNVMAAQVFIVQKINEILFLNAVVEVELKSHISLATFQTQPNAINIAKEP